MNTLGFIIFLCYTILIPMDYLEAGYDKFLTKTPVNILPSEVDPLQFEQFAPSISGEKIVTKIEGDLVGSGINASNIETGQMSFDRARGGTLLLGGYNNQNGIFSLRDDQDIERLILDKDGMVIKKGKITIQDASNNTVIDEKGIVSTSFLTDSIRNTTTRSNSGVGTDTIAGTTLQFDLSRSARVLILYSSKMQFSGMTIPSEADGNTILIIDNVQYGMAIGVHTHNVPGSSSSPYLTASSQYLANLGAGHHELSLKSNRSGSGQLDVLETIVTYIILGK